MSSDFKEKAANKSIIEASTNKNLKNDCLERPADVKSTVSSMSKKDSSSSLTDRERRKKEHNEVEQRRKEKIKQIIYRMGDLLPPSASLTDRERPSTVEIMEKSLVCMREWKEVSSTSGAEIQRLKDELGSVKQERDALMAVARDAGLLSADGSILTNAAQAAMEDGNMDPLGEARSTNGVSSTTDAKPESPKAKPKKSKRRNNISAQLQARRELETQQQEMITSSVPGAEDQQMGIGSADMLNMAGGQFMPGQNMMPVMLPNGQLIMPGMMGGMLGNNPGMMGNQGLVGNNQPGLGNNQGLVPNQQSLMGNTQNDVNMSGTGMNKSGPGPEESEAGLLQLAMQDAGITPQSSSQSAQGDESATTPKSDVGTDMTNTQQNSALQTLASVATSSQGMSVGESMGGTQVSTAVEVQSTLGSGTSSASVPSVSGSLPIRTSGPAGYQSIVQNGQVINVPVMGNQSILQGQGQGQLQGQQVQGQQQVLFINEQGIPVIANVPVGMEQNNQGNQLLNNLQKQNQGLDQNALALAQQQSNIAALQGQIIGPNGQSLQNLAFQQSLLQQGGILPNGQILQQLGGQGQLTQVQGQGQMVNLQGQGGMVLGGPPGMLPGNQNGNLLTVPNQQNQLPSFLQLPNGQIIPVVTNPGGVFSQAGPPQMSGMQNRLAAPPPHIQAQLQGGQNQVIVGPFQAGQGSQGLLMPVSSGALQQATSSGTSHSSTSLSTSVVPTSAIHSVMTTQIQGSTMSQKSPSTAASRSDGTLPGTNSVTSIKASQPLPTGPGTILINTSGAGAIPGGPGGQPQPGGIGIPGGNKSAPILITLPINGQPTSVLVDPVTMQVLGTVQQNGQSSVSGATPVVPGVSQTTQMLGAKTNTAATSGGSKSKKSKQRDIVPKPGAPGQVNKPTTASSKKKSSKAKVVELAQPDSVSDSLQIQIPESTTEPDTSTHTTEASPSSTDILAKAAASIFSTSMSELTTPVGGFYNPANEDNPLHIDTSAAEVEEDTNKGAEKTTGNNDKINTKTTESLQHTEQSLVDPKSSVIDTLVSEADVTSLSATLEDIADMRFAEEQREIELSSNKTSKDLNSTSIFNLETKEPNKTSESVSTVETVVSKTELKSSNIDIKEVSKDTFQQKKGGGKKRKNKNADMMDTLDDTLHVLHIPEAASLSEDLNDVLDQVEHFGGVNIDSPAKVTKKGKSKRSKPADSEGEPNVKKRKGANKDKNTVTAEPLLSMPAVVTGPLSVYDFDGTDDIVPQLLPLNAKEFSVVTPGKGSVAKDQVMMETNANTNIKSNVNVQSKNSAQLKADRFSASASKNTKSAKNVKDTPVSAAKNPTDQPLLLMPETFPADKKDDNSNKNTDEKPVQSLKEQSSGKQSVKSSSKIDEVFPSMPELDTTTSLFGFPVPRKPQYSPEKISPNKTSFRPNEQSLSKSGSVAPKQTMNLFPVPSTKELHVSPKISPISPLFSNKTTQSSKETSVSVSSSLNSVASQNSALTSQGSVSDKTVTVSQTNISESMYSKVTQSKSQSVIASVPSSMKNDSLYSPAFNVSDSNLFKESERNNKTSGSDSAKISDSQPNKNLNLNKKASESVSTNSDILSEINSFTKSEKDLSDRSKNSHLVSSNNNSISQTSTNSFPDTSKVVTSPMKNAKLNDSGSSSSSRLNGSGEYTEMSFGEFVSTPKSVGKPNTDTGSSFGNTNFSSPYSSESIFSSASKPLASVVKSPPNVTVSPSGKITQKSDNASVVKGRSNIYSADNFVSSGAENMALGGKLTDMTGKSDFMSSTDSFSRLQNESSSDGFNFANIGLNIAPIVTTAPSSSYMDLTSLASSSAVTSSTPSSFSFSLSSSSAASGAITTTTSSVLGQHQFPFYPPVLTSSASGLPETEQPQGLMANNNMFNSNNTMQRSNPMQRRDNSNRMGRNDNVSLQRNDSNMPRNDSMQNNSKRNETMSSNMPRNDSVQNSMNRNESMTSNIPRNENMQINMNRNENIQSNMNRNDNLQNNMSRNDTMPANTSRNDATQNNLNRNDGMQSNISRNDNMQNNMNNRNDAVQSNIARNESTQNSLNRNDTMSSNIPRNDSAQNNLNRNDTLSSNIPRNDNVQNNMNRNDNMPMNQLNTNVQRVDNTSSNMPRVETMRDDSKQGSDLNTRRAEDPSKPSCSKQAKLSKPPSSSMPDLYPFSSPPNPAEQNFYGNRNTQMKSNLGKSPTEQMHKHQDKVMSELGPPQSRPNNPQDKRSGPLDRSPQLMVPGLSELGPPQSRPNNPQDKRSGPLDRSPQLMGPGQPYFPPQNFPPAKSLNTPPLHHPPMMDDRVRNMTNRSPYDISGPPSSQGFNPLVHNYPGPGNRFDGGPPNFNRDHSGTQPLSHTPMNASGRKSTNPTQQKQPPAPPLVSMSMPPQSRPAPPQPSQRPTPPLITPPQAPTPSQINPPRPKQTASRSSKSKKSKQHPYVEVDSNLSNSIFETNRSMTPFFPVQNLSPQSRAMQHEGSPFLPGNFFGPGPRLPNANTPFSKNSDISNPFNPLFPPGRAQNGLGLQFQPGFGMNMNPLHGNHGNSPQITPHTGVGSHMPNFNLNNIFSDVNSSQSESLNISPIKFGHANSMLQHQPGMEPGSMQHHQQNYRGHPPPPPSVLSMNSILGPNHPGFDGRPLGHMNTSMAPPFHNHGHPPFIPPLNFSMHDH